MDIPEHGRSKKRGFEEHSNHQSNRFDDDDLDDKRKPYKSSKIDESEEWDSVGRRKDNGYGKKLKHSIEAESRDEDDYETKRSSRSKTPKKNQDDRTEKRPSSYYLERESDNSRKSRVEERDKSLAKKDNAKLSSEEGTYGKSRSKSNALGDGDDDKTRYIQRIDRKDSSTRETDHVIFDSERISSRKQDDPDSTKKNADRGGSDFDTVCNDSEVKPGRAHERSVPMNWEGQSKVDSEMGGRSSKKEDGKLDDDQLSRGKLDVREEDGRNSVREERSEELKDDKYRRGREEIDSGTVRPSSKAYVVNIDKHTSPRISTHRALDEREIPERSDEDPGRLGDRSGKDVRRTSKRSRTPERNDRRWGEQNEVNHTFSDSDNERSSSLRDKAYDNDGYRDDRRKNKDTSSWNDRNRSWDGAKDGWKRRNLNRYDREPKAVNTDFGYEKEWGDIPKRERERPDYDKTHGRPYRRDRGRLDGGHESSDTIEIRTNSFDYGGDESGPGFSSKRSHSNMHADYSSVNEEWGHMHEDRPVVGDAHGSTDDNHDRFPNDSLPEDQNGPNTDRKNYDMQGDKGRAPKGPMLLNHSNGNQIVDNSGFSQGSSGSFNKSGPHGAKGAGRPVRGGRGRATGRDTQRFALPLQMMAPPFSPMVLPPGQMPPIGPNMTPAPGPSMGPSVFVNPFPSPQLIWPGGRGVEMNMLGVPPGLPPLPSQGPVGSRFPPSMANGLNPAFFNQIGAGRGASAGLSGPGFNPMAQAGRGMQHEKAQGGWVPPRSCGPSGKAPSRGEQNDYSQNFVDTGMRPQNFIRELELTNTVEDYPKLRELIQKKDEIVANASTPPMYFKADLKEFILSSEFFGTKFDVILVDPPWEEYVHRAPGVSDHMEYWTFEEISNLKIEAIADTPSFIFLWVGDGVGLEQGRACLKKWGFRRCEDICWVKTNKNNATPGLRHDAHTLFQHSKEHCLMGIKGTVRRSTDGHIIHANIDTDIIIAEEPPYGSTTKPEDMYRIIEHFSLGRRRLELFGEDHNIRTGWLTVGKGLSSSNFNRESYVKPFADKDGKVWQGGGGRNPPPDAPHLVVTTPDIEGLRPKSPPAKNQQSLPPQLLPQLQSQPSLSIQTTANSSSKRPINSPQNMTPTGPHGLNQEASSSNTPFSMPMPWASPMSGHKIAFPDGSNNMATFDGFGFSSSYGQPNMDPSVDFDPQRTYNMF